MKNKYGLGMDPKRRTTIVRLHPIFCKSNHRYPDTEHIESAHSYKVDRCRMSRTGKATKLRISRSKLRSKLREGKIR